MDLEFKNDLSNNDEKFTMLHKVTKGITTHKRWQKNSQTKPDVDWSKKQTKKKNRKQRTVMTPHENQ